MRVLLTTEASMAGAGRHVLDLAEGLLGRDCEVHLVYSPRRQDDAFRQRRQAMRGLQATELAMHRAPRPSDMGAIQRFRSYLRQAGPFDVVHAHSSKAGAIARLAGRGQDALQVYTPHCIFTMNPTLGKLRYQMYRAIECRLARHTDAIIAVSEDEYDHLRSLGMRPRTVHCIPNGIASQAWAEKRATRESLGLPLDGTIVGFVGRFDSQKNPHLMLESFARIESSRTQPYLAMVGSGPAAAELHRLADDLGIAERVFWPGYCPAEATMPAFDLFAMPSRYEALPYVLLEALSAGLPIVATSVGGASNTIDDGRNGYIVGRQERDAIAAALSRLVEDEERRLAFARASRLKAASFSIDIMVERIQEVYRQLRSSRGEAEKPVAEAAVA